MTVKLLASQATPIPVVLHCPHCGKQHVDEGVWATKPHRTHQCVDDACGAGCGKPFTPSAHRTFGVLAKDLKFEPIDASTAVAIAKSMFDCPFCGCGINTRHGDGSCSCHGCGQDYCVEGH